MLASPAVQGDPHYRLKQASWVGVDWDGTMVDEGRRVDAMVYLVKRLLELGVDVRIFTARVTNPDTLERALALREVRAACKAWFGRELPVTATKDEDCHCLIDDRAVSVVSGKGSYTDPNRLVARLLEKAP